MVLNDVSKQYDRAEFLTSNRYVYITRGIRGRTGRKTERERVTLTINQEEIFTLFVIKRYLVDRRPFLRGRTYVRTVSWYIFILFLYFFFSSFSRGTRGRNTHTMLLTCPARIPCDVIARDRLRHWVAAQCEVDRSPINYGWSSTNYETSTHPLSSTARLSSCGCND